MLKPWNFMFWVKAKKILAVDDEPNVLIMIRKILELFGYNVITASSGSDALNVVESVKPDLIILDINMPGLDGIAVLEKLKGNFLTQHIPVIFLTANYIKPEHAIVRKAADYLTKPFSRKDLLNSIEKAFYSAKHNKKI